MMTAQTLVGGSESMLRVVVADDDPNEQLLLSAAVQDLDLRAHFEFVSDGEQLLQLLKMREAESALPDLVVLDLRMPNMNGHEALEAIAHQQGLWNIPVLVWTSSADPQEPNRCWAEGAVWFERKPESFTGYVEMVHTLEERCRRAREVADSTLDLDAVLAQLVELDEAASEAAESPPDTNGVGP